MADIICEQPPIEINPNGMQNYKQIWQQLCVLSMESTNVAGRYERICLSTKDAKHNAKDVMVCVKTYSPKIGGGALSRQPPGSLYNIAYWPWPSRAHLWASMAPYWPKIRKLQVQEWKESVDQRISNPFASL